MYATCRSPRQRIEQDASGQIVAEDVVLRIDAAFGGLDERESRSERIFTAEQGAYTSEPRMRIEQRRQHAIHHCDSTWATASAAILCGRDLPQRMPTKVMPRTFQELIFALQKYWSDQGCVILQPYDMEMGAGTFHTATFLRSIGPEPWSAAYVQPSRRPTDGRYGDNPFRLQRYYQFQVVIKPSPLDILDRYVGSLKMLGFDPLTHDIRFVEDNWRSEGHTSELQSH